MDLNSWDTRLLLIIVLLAINLILKLKSFRSSLDYDTSNHIYFAFLKYHKVPFFASYRFGVKKILPRLYTIGWKLLKTDPYRFRIFNIVSSSLVIILWVLTDSFIDDAEIPFYLLGTILINSLWVNYMSSATEFHSVALIMVMFFLPNIVPFQAAWILQLVLLAFLVGSFKIINGAYILPILAFYDRQILEYLWLVIPGIILFSLYIFWGLSRNFLSVKQYVTNRKWLNPKSVKFIILNPHFCLFIFLLGIGNIYYNSWEWGLLQFVLWGIFLIQRCYTGYMFYPSLVLGLYIAFQTEWLCAIPFFWGLILLFLFFAGHTFFHILIRSPREIVLRFRKRICMEDYSSYLGTRERQVQVLRDKVKKKDSVYLWGSDVVLLLLAKLIHTPNTFYSHNYLFYWSDIKDKQNYAINYLLNEKPRYVIEASIVENMKFPIDKFKNMYTQIGSVGHMTVFERIGLKRSAI